MEKGGTLPWEIWWIRPCNACRFRAVTFGQRQLSTNRTAAGSHANTQRAVCDSSLPFFQLSSANTPHSKSTDSRLFSANGML